MPDFGSMPSSKPKNGSQSRFILCADDYGLAPENDQAILILARQRRVSAISCMVHRPDWPHSAEKLAAISNIDLGLHLVLTDYATLSGASGFSPNGQMPSQWRIGRQALARRIDRVGIRSEMDAQIDRFSDTLGRTPDFVDGHQLVHQLPIVRDALLDAIRARKGWRPWIRVCTDNAFSIFKRQSGLGPAFAASILGKGLKAAVAREGLPANDGFSGFYNVRNARAYAQIFPRFMRSMGRRHLVMCHPGLPLASADPWSLCRKHEFNFLTGPVFEECLDREHAILSRFSDFRGETC